MKSVIKNFLSTSLILGLLSGIGVVNLFAQEFAFDEKVTSGPFFSSELSPDFKEDLSRTKNRFLPSPVEHGVWVSPEGEEVFFQKKIIFSDADCVSDGYINWVNRDYMSLKHLMMKPIVIFFKLLSI